MKKTVIILLIIIFLLSNISVFATHKLEGEDENETENKKKDHVLIVGDDMNYPPYSYIDDNNEPVGFNIEIIKASASASGIEVEIKLDDWSTVRKSLDNGKIDAISGMFYSEERDKMYDFTDNHSISNGDIFTRKGMKLNSIKDLMGKKVVVQKDDIIAEYLAKENEEQNLNIKLIEVLTVREALRLVNDEVFDYAGVSKLPALYTLKELDINLKYHNLFLVPHEYSMAVKEGNKEILLALNSGLQIIKLNGEYNRIYEKWLGVYEKKDMFYYIQKYQWFFYLTLIVVLLLILITIFLKHIVKIRTAELEKQNIIIINKNELLIESKENLESKLEEIEKQKKYIEYIASTDFLTKLPNRRSFIRELNKILSDNKAGVFILLDIDNFKNINDTMGHIFGDQVLISVSKILKEVEEENRYIYVARFGGDEFLILYKNIISEIRIKKFMEEFMNIFDKKIEIDNLYVNIDFSIGISKFPYDSNDENQLLTNADLALNYVKKSGKNNYKFFDDKMKEIINKKISIEFIIRSAIEEDGFKILYQPQVDIKTGKIKSYEALIRLKKYNISPAEFIPICEENGMIIEVDRIVTHKVIKQLSLWKEKFKELKTVSINYSGKQLQDYGYYDFLCSELQKYDIDPKYIEIEITENIFLEKEGITNIFLNKIRNLGIEISIDDFGTGYSSLNYLISLPISKVKIDKSLINKFLEKDFSKTRDVVKSLIYLCRNLDLKVVAEGVEYIEQFNHLNKSGCDYIQGYFFSKPKEAKEIEEDYYINYLDEMNIDFELDSEERL